MKKIIFFLLASLTSLSLFSTDLTGVKIYINPGHGGYDSNDRSVWTIPVPEEWTNPAGYWESKSNLSKGLALRTMLQAAGATVYISRTDNSSGIRDGAQFAGGGDRDLSEIAEEANANNVDAFLSIHSNAINGTTNYLLLLYHGYDNNPTVAASLPMVQKSGPIQITNQLTVWTSSSPMLRGDFTFYGDTYGLGVLRPLTVPGFLSEGSFHDYAPETHRLMNDDYCKLEAYSFYRFYHEYFERDMPAKGVIGGFVKSGNEKVTTLNQSKFKYVAGSHDQWLPLNAATVTLSDASGANVIGTYTTDTWYNGIFAFYDLTPGSYKVTAQPAGSDYDPVTADVTVEAGKTAYAKILALNKNLSQGGTPYVDYPDPEQEAGITAVNQYDFEEAAAPQNPDWLQGATIKRALYRNGKYYVLTAEPKILVVNAETNTLIKELDLTGIAGGSPILSDIAFTADNYLVACNRESIPLASPSVYFKVYTWDNDDAAPAVLFQSQKQGNWGEGIVGETFAVSGRRSELRVYVPAVTTGTSKAIRIVAFEFDGTATDPPSKYMLDAANYTEALWGEHYTFTISPSGNRDHFYVDSPVLLPVEYQFDWSKPDRDPLTLKATFAEKSGYALGLEPSGNAVFRYAQHTYLAAPVCETGFTQVGVALFDITGGLDNAEKVSVKYPENGLGASAASYMMAAAKVTNADIDLLILAQNQGVARYQTATKPTANIYASELSVTADNKFKFTLNEDALSVVITLFNSDGDIIANYDAGALAKGVHEIAHDFAGAPLGSYSWRVTAQARSVGAPTKVSDDSQQFLFYAPRGVAVDNSPESPFFGRVYVAESVGGAITVGSPDPTRTTTRGIYVLNAGLQDITGQEATAYAGGLTRESNVSASYQFDPGRLAVASDGKVYVPSSIYTTPGLWIMDPANPSANFTPVFGGTADAAGVVKNGEGVTIHNPIINSWISGSGTDTQLFTLDRSSSPAHGRIYRYDIGDLSALPWTAAPSAVLYDDATGNMINAYGNIAPDGRGGWWMSQYRAGTGGVANPVLVHITNGSINYNSGTNMPNGYYGAMAVNADRTLLAVATKAGEAEVYSITFGDSDVPALELKYTIVWSSGYLTGIAFDAADNVYIVSNGNERLMVYSLPKADNTFTTTAAMPFTVASGLDPAKANVYASELSVTADNKFKFTLNDNTQSVVITLLKDGETAATYNAGALAKGVHELAPDFSILPFGNYSWSVTAKGAAIAEVTKVSDDSERFLFWGPRGVAVDNSFESPFFGRVYASEGSGGQVTAGSPDPTRTTTRGVYIFNAALDDVTTQGTAAYAGDVTWGGLYRLAVAPDGKVYVTDNGTANSGIWIMDPANPTAAFTPVFGGTRSATGISTNDEGETIHGRIPHAWVEGTGENAKLYTFDAGANNTGNINRYDIGTATLPWTAAPSAIVYDDAANGNLQQNFNSSIVPDGRGGWWISQYRATDNATIPSLIHFNTTTEAVDFNSGSTGLLGASYQGGMAVSVDGNLLAIGAASGNVKVFDVTYDETGAPTLTEKHTIATATGAYAIGVALDVAGNLYAIDNNQERLRVYALPKAENSFTTPASMPYRLSSGLDPAKANVYASELSRTGNAFKFTLNDNAEEVVITLYDAGNNVAATYSAGPLAKGVKTVTHDFTSQLTAGSTYSWSVTAKAEAIETVTKISDDSERFLFWGPRGVAVDNSFESPFFGRVYTAEGSGGQVTEGAPSPTRTTTRGVYIFNAALDDVTTQGATAYAGDVTWGGLYRLAVAPDGKVYVTDQSMANSGIWIMDPANPTTAFNPVFGGTRDATGISTNSEGATIHGRIPHAWVEGTGENAKLYTYDAGANNTGNINRYDIGAATLPWTAAPSAIVYDDAVNGNLQQGFNSSIVPDGRGGWWISQYRATDNATIPSLIHFNTTTGTVDFNSGSTGLIGSSYQGGMAVSVDGNLLAIGATSGNVKVFDVTYDETGVPTLTEKHTIATATGAYAIGVALDVAGNLYAIDNMRERLRVYALPKAENSFTTPAQAAYNLVVASSAAPTVTGFTLDNGAAVALRRTVDLTYTLSGGAPLEFIVSETPDFSDATWQPYNPAALTYTFASDAHGLKTVYTKLRNDRGETAVVNDEIIYKPLHPMSITDFTVNSGAAYTNSRNVTLNHTVENGVPLAYSASEELSQVGKHWLPYVEAPVYRLSEGIGRKEIFFAVANTTDTSAIVSDRIYLDEAVTVDEHGLIAKLFPNPVETDLNVVVEDGYSGTVDVTVYSITGVVCMRQTAGAALFRLDLSKCPVGVLLVKLSSGNNYTVKRIIKL